ncbi:glutamate receptor ionotropic, delta-2-like [Pollicipes pollicipes]|uniref:glutamate receptor ionotropic, delta-2-like n=1 Tax=Pollicipes pollicipes TaxID=41117 RepID=UPI0018856D64|nr:glutamate receptor ionotropic, delta-2-like [Pollicipes pollicipes]
MTGDDGRLVALTTETLSAADLPRVVSLSEVAPADLQRRLRGAFWQQDVPVLTSPPRFPPATRLTVLLAGSLGHPALEAVLRENERAMLVSCANDSCASLAATSPGRDGVRLVPWTPGTPPPDWKLRQLGGRTLRVLAPLRKKLVGHCTSPVIAAYIAPDNRTQLCGYLGQTLNILADNLNFEPRLIRKSGCGRLQLDGSLNGRPSWLIAGRGDLGAGTCTVDVKRSSAVYMGEWFWSDTTSIGTAQPDHWHSDFLVFGVFTPEVWGLSALYVLLYAAILRVAELAGGAVRSRPTGCRSVGRSARAARADRQRVPSVTAYVQQSLRMFLGQGDDVTSAQPATRLLMMFIYMSTVTLMSIYAGNLTAFLSIGRYSAAIETLEELAASPIEPHVTFGQSHYYIFENATSGARGRIWRKMQACDGCVHARFRTTETPEFVAALVRGGRSLFQSQRALLMRADNHLARTGQPSAALCPIRIARQALRRDFYSLMFPHHSQYSELFDRAIRRLRYQGVIQRIFGQVAANRCTRSAPLSHGVAPLDLHRLVGAFYVWLAGMGAALLVLVTECCLGCRRTCYT